MTCLLCDSPTEIFFSKQSKQRGQLDYRLCQDKCGLAFLDPTHRVDANREKARYNEHNNTANDGYVAFLKRVTDDLIPHIKSDMIGLDFGCGPNPVLSTIMNDAGYEMYNYDPFYFPNKSALSQQYDFITATEVIEHVYDPAQVIDQLKSLLKPNGILAIMTETMLDPERFADWWYHRDITHVCFYSEQTLQWIADQQNWKLAIPQKNIAIFKTP